MKHLAPMSAWLVAGMLLAPMTRAWAAENPAAQPAASSASMTPVQLVQSAPRGSLKNPYTNDAAKIAEGHELFMSYGCNGCHGGTGGGGMCPQINGDVWFYGMGDDVLFRLITLGSVEMLKQGFDRLGGPGLQMPPYGEILKTDDDLWKILAWVRSIYTGDPKKKFW